MSKSIAPPVRRAAARSSARAPERGHAKAPAPRTDLDRMLGVMRGGPRSELPYRAVLERHLRGDLSGVEVYRGATARPIADAFDTRAFAVGNVVGFVEDRPAFGLVAHEIAHVVQMRGPSPRACDQVHPLGPAPRDSPYEHALDPGTRLDLPAMAYGFRAPIALYRAPNDKPPADTDPDKLEGRARKAMLKMAQTAPYKLSTAFTGGKPYFSLKSGDDYKPEFTESSTAIFQRKQFVETAYSTGEDSAASYDLQKLFDNSGGTPFALSGTLVVGGKNPYLVKVRRPGSSSWSDEYAFVGKTDAGGAPTSEEVWLIPGRMPLPEKADKDAQKPADTLTAYGMIIKDLRAVAGGNSRSLPLLDPVQKDLDAAQVRAGNPDKKSPEDLDTELRKYVEDIRHKFVKAVVDSYTDMDELHTDVFASKIFRQTVPPSKEESSYEKIRGTLFELWLSTRYPGRIWERVAEPGKDEKVVQPIFGEKKGDKYIKSPALEKVRHGDGVLRVKGGDGIEQYLAIAEAKAYTDKTPSPDNVLQMQDYARIITIPILGYFAEKVGDTIVTRTHQFKRVDYFFSNADVAGGWVIDLDKQLAANYTATPDPRKTKLSIDQQLDAYTETIANVRKFNASSIKGKKGGALVGLEDVEAKIKDAKAATSKEEAERQKDVDAIQAALAQAIVDSYPDIDALYGRALEKDKVFPKGVARTAGIVVEKWLAKNGGGRTIDASLTTPIGGERRAVRPLFGADAFTSGPDSDWGKKLKAANADLVLLDDHIIIDCTKVTAAPTPEDENIAKDVKRLLDGTVYLITPGGDGARLFARVIKGVDYEFPPDKADLAGTWKTTLQKIYAEKFATEVKLKPDPDKPKNFVLRFSLNPVFEANVKDADTLSPPVEVTTKKPGVVIDKVVVKLTAVRTAEIESGSITFGISNDAAKGVVSSDGPQTKPIAPQSVKPDAKPSDKPVHGKIENRLTGLKSKLDKLLKRIETDAKIVDKGIEATLRVTPGETGIPKLDLTDGEVKVTIGGTPAAPQLDVKGTLGLSTGGGKLKGKLVIAWSKSTGALSITGTAHVEKLIDGLEPVDATIEYVSATTDKPESLKIGIKHALFKKKLGGVTLGGEANDLVYDVNTGGFSGKGTLSADLGAFGKAQASVEIKDNLLSEAEIKYESTELKYPTKNPVVGGTVSGKVNYKGGNLSGDISGAGWLKVDALKKLSPDPIKLSAAIHVAEDGALSGGLKLDSAIQLGKYFRIEAFSADVDRAGRISSDVTLTLSNIPVIKGRADASVQCHIDDKNGFKVVKASLAWEFGEKEKSRFWGKIKVDYAGKFILSADLGVRIKEGMFATGKVIYDSEKNSVWMQLTLPRIPLLKFGPKTHKIFGLGPKQISIVQVPLIVGLYIDADFQLDFEYKFELYAVPKIQLKEFSFDTFAFKGATAEVALEGDGLMAKLIATPRLGIGAFAIHPMVLRGGGGLSMPIEGVAQLKPTKNTKVWFSYDAATENSDAKVSAGAKVGLVMTFRVDASINPWAELVVLNGVYKLPWKGAPLANFQLLPERELFTFEVNFGDPVKTEDAPELPTKSKAPTKDEGRKTFKSEQGGGGAQVKKETPDTGSPVPSKANTEEAGKEDKGFDIMSVVKGIAGDGMLKKIWDMIQSVADTIAAIAGFIGNIVKTIKSWFSGAWDAVAGFLKGLKAADYKLFKYLLTILKGKMSPTMFGIIEPILSALAQTEDKVWRIIDRGIPESVGGWIDLIVDLLSAIFGLAWSGPVAVGKSINRLVSALVDYGESVVQSVKDLVGVWVTEGRIGAVMHGYFAGIGPLRKSWRAADQYRIHIGGFDVDHKPDRDWPFYELSSAPALPIWGALAAVGAPKNSRGNFWTEDES